MLMLYRGIEQLVARRAHNPEVGGSSPSPATEKEVGQLSNLFFAITETSGLFALFHEGIGYDFGQIADCYL